MLNLIENAVSIKLKKTLTKESQEAGSFFCPPDQKVWCTHAGIFKLFLFPSFTAQSVPMAVQTVGMLLLPKTVQRPSARQWTKNPQVRRFVRDVCAVQGMASSSMWTCLPTGQGICRKGIQQGLVSCSLLRATSRVWLSAWSQRAPFTPGQKCPAERSDTCPLTQLLPCGVFTPKQCSWRYFAWLLRILKTAVKKKSKIATLKEMKSYKQKLLNSSPLSLLEP